MGHRHNDIGPRLALWMLVALGDIILLLVSVGFSAPVAVLTVAALVVAGVATWRLARRTTPTGRAARDVSPDRTGHATAGPPHRWPVTDQLRVAGQRRVAGSSVQRNGSVRARVSPALATRSST